MYMHSFTSVKEALYMESDRTYALEKGVSYESSLKKEEYDFLRTTNRASWTVTANIDSHKDTSRGWHDRKLAGNTDSVTNDRDEPWYIFYPQPNPTHLPVYHTPLHLLPLLSPTPPPPPPPPPAPANS